MNAETQQPAGVPHNTSPPSDQPVCEASRAHCSAFEDVSCAIEGEVGDDPWYESAAAYLVGFGIMLFLWMAGFALIVWASKQ